MGVPATIGRYEILEELGRGSMGVVYKARDPRIGRVVALKTIAFSFPIGPDEEEEFLQRFYHEAQVAGRLNHPNIVTIYDVGEKGPEGEAYIAMEYATGTNLHDLLAGGGRLPLQQVAEVVEKLGQALDYAHQNEVIHRDVKPANIILTESGQPKILDFGIARLAAGGLTRPGKFFGTPNYMAPEQVTGTDVDGRADQFSLAVILYQLLTGEKPFTGDSVTAISYQVVNVDPAPPSRLNPSLRPAFDRILRKALSKHAGDRYARCQEFAEELKTAVLEWMQASEQAIPPTLVSGSDRSTPPEGGVHGITFLRPRWGFLSRAATPLGWGWLVFLVCLALLASSPFLIDRPASGKVPVASGAARTPWDAVVPGAGAGGPPVVTQPARLKLSFQHRFTAARIVVRVDGGTVVDDALKGSGARRRWSRELTVPPGRHRIEVRVVSGDRSFDEIEGIEAAFRSGEVKDLRLSSGGLGKRLRLRFEEPGEGTR